MGCHTPTSLQTPQNPSQAEAEFERRPGLLFVPRGNSLQGSGPLPSPNDARADKTGGNEKSRRTTYQQKLDIPPRSYLQLSNNTSNIRLRIIVIEGFFTI